jgi:nucleotidyltransferase/DNA polymerase involved in DNA repair
MAVWGVDKVTGQIFDRLAIRTIVQLRPMPLDTLNDLFGALFEALPGLNGQF